MKSLKKHQNNKTSHGVKVFLENNMFLFHTFPKINILQLSIVLPKMITLKQSYDQFKFKWWWKLCKLTTKY